MTLVCLFLSKKVARLLLVLSILNLGCRSSHVLLTPTNGNKLSTEDSAKPILLPSDSSDEIYTGLKQKNLVVEFYNRISNKPAWIENNAISLLGDSMIWFVENVRYYGLLPRNYHVNEIRIRNDNVVSQQDEMRLEALLTDSFFSIAKDLKEGRMNADENSKGDSLRIAMLQRVMEGQGLRRMFELQEPSFSGYRSLKEALRLCLDTMNLDDRDVLLRGYTYIAIPVHQKIQSIEINMERWRWERSVFGKRYLWINIPSYKLEVISGNSVVMESRVIVGKPETPTPVLSSVMECFVIYPYWNVPRKIAVEEYLPIIQSDSTFINRNHFDVLNRRGTVLNPDSVDWNQFNANYFPVRFRQREGPENSLGVLKFVFENPYAVFLHDTNAKRLFNTDTRALSHGCIRVEKAVELAHYLVTGSLAKKSAVIDDQLGLKNRYPVNLARHMPIYVRYFTCEFRNRVLYQYRDVYNEDQQIIDGLYK